MILLPPKISAGCGLAYIMMERHPFQTALNTQEHAQE